MRIWMLALLVLFSVLVTAEPARADDGMHAHHHGQAEAGQNQPSPPMAADHDGCHCMFTGCMPVLPGAVVPLTVSQAPFRHPMPPALIAWAGLGSQPPSEPPRS